MTSAAGPRRRRVNRPAVAPARAPGRRRRLAGADAVLPAAARRCCGWACSSSSRCSSCCRSRCRPAPLETGYQLTFALRDLHATRCRSSGHQFLRSFVYARPATVLALLIGYPLAYAIAFKSGRWKPVLLVLVIAPFFTSFLHPHAGLADHPDSDGAGGGLLPQHPPVSLTRALGWTNGDQLLATPLAVVTGLTYNFLPFMTLPLYASLERLDPRLLEAAGDLYATPLTAFRKITLPLSLPGVVAGTLLTFIPAAGDYINSQLLGNPKTAMIGQVIDGLVPAGPRLPDRRGAVLRADADDRGAGLGLRAPRRNGGAGLMVATVRQRPAAPAAVPARRRRSPLDGAARARGLAWSAVLALVYLLLPNVVVILFSFNKPNGRFNYTWTAVLPRRLAAPVRPRRACASRWGCRLKIGLAATVVATRARHPGRVRAGPAPLPRPGRANLLIFLPMATPEVVMGSSLLTLFVSLRHPAGPDDHPDRAHHVLPELRGGHGQGPGRRARPAAGAGGRGPVRQRVADLPAGSPLPLVAPGIAAGALLAFSLSFDDYIITNFNAGNASITFPMYVWGAAAARHAGADQRHRHGDVRTGGAGGGVGPVGRPAARPLSGVPAAVPPSTSRETLEEAWRATAHSSAPTSPSSACARCDWADPASYADADVVILGAPFDGGTSHRSGHPVRAAVHPADLLPAPRRVAARRWRCASTG